MKLYTQDGEVLFDYSDVDTKACNDSKSFQYTQFLRDTECGWEPTLKPKVKRMVCEHMPWATPYGNSRKLRKLAGNCYYRALYLSEIEISDDFKPFLDKLEETCVELQKVEREKEQAREAEMKWKNVCKFGCGGCEHNKRWNDDRICEATGDILPERTVPKNRGKTFYPFNLEAFPTDKCPFNVNKDKEISA
jgi:hypothetical protein